MSPHDFGQLRLERIDANGLDDASFLSHAECLRLESMSHPNRRRQFIAGRVLTRRLFVALSLGPTSEDLIEVAPSGQTLLRHHPSLHLSISHSRQWVGCVIANLPVGLDIEQVDEKRATPELIEQVCSAAEQSLFNSLSSAARDRLFTELWTVKEAWLKRRGAALDVARMRAIKWASSRSPDGNCASWSSSQNVSVTVLGPPARIFLADCPIHLRDTPATIRQVQSS